MRALNCITSVLSVALGLGVLAAPVSPAASQAIGKTVEEIIALARKEPPVRVAGAWERPIEADITKGFKAKYGLSLRHERVSGLDSRERILSEAIAGVLPYDIVNVSGELRSLFINAKVIRQVEWRKLFPDIDTIHFSPDNYFVVTGFSQYGAVYNPKRVKPEHVPKTWEDCLNPVFKGVMAIQSRGRGFTPLHKEWGREKSLDYHKRLKALDPIFSAGQTEMVVQIAAGEHPISCSMAYHSYVNVKRKDPTADLGYSVLKEMPVNISEAFGIISSSKSPNASILLVAYAAKEGQPAYKHIGRTSPFVAGSEADEMVKKTGAKVVWQGWEFVGEPEVQAAREIVTAWGFRADTIKAEGDEAAVAAAGAKKK